MATRIQTFGPMFPKSNLLPGTEEYNSFYGLTPNIEDIDESYVDFSATEKVKGEYVNSNDVQNPLNALLKKMTAEPETKKIVAGPKRSIRPPEKTATPPVPPVPSEDEFSAVLKKSPPRKEKSKSPPIIPGPQPVELVEVTPVPPKRNIRTYAKVENVGGDIQNTSSGLKFFKIEPLRIGTLPPSMPPKAWDFPRISIPMSRLYVAPGRNIRGRPIVTEGIKGIESFRPGESASAVLRTIDPEKLVAKRAKKGGKIYTNNEISVFAGLLGIKTGKSKQETVDKILAEYNKWKESGE